MDTLKLKKYKAENPPKIFGDATWYFVPETEPLALRCELLEEFVNEYSVLSRASEVGTSNPQQDAMHVGPKDKYTLNARHSSYTYVLFIALNTLSEDKNYEEWDALSRVYNLTPLLLRGS